MQGGLLFGGNLASRARRLAVVIDCAALLEAGVRPPLRRRAVLTARPRPIEGRLPRGEEQRQTQRHDHTESPQLAMLAVERVTVLCPRAHNTRVYASFRP